MTEKLFTGTFNNNKNKNKTESKLVSMHHIVNADCAIFVIFFLEEKEISQTV